MAQTFIFKQDGWFFRTYDGRRKEFKKISKEEFELAKEKHIDRAFCNRIPFDPYKKRRELIAFFATIPYQYEGDGLDDYSKYQRPASSGKGYVAICPGERGNNFYIDDPILVAYLTNKFNKHYGK